jgi:hypothetical protein
MSEVAVYQYLNASYYLLHCIASIYSYARLETICLQMHYSLIRDALSERLILHAPGWINEHQNVSGFWGEYACVPE